MGSRCQDMVRWKVGGWQLYNWVNQEKTLNFQGFREFEPDSEIENFYEFSVNSRVPGEVKMASWILLD